jgi:hypothetical protein
MGSRRVRRKGRGDGVAPAPETAAAWWRLRARYGDREARGWLAFHGYDLP